MSNLIDWLIVISVVSYITLDFILYIKMRSRVLKYWNSQGKLVLYSYLALTNIPTAIYNKIKDGDIAGDYKHV